MRPEGWVLTSLLPGLTGISRGATAGEAWGTLMRWFKKTQWHWRLQDSLKKAQSWEGGQRRVGWKRVIMKRWYSIHRSPINMVATQKRALTVFSEHMVSGLSALKWKQSWRRGSCHFLVKSLLRISGKQSGPIILHSQDFCPSRQDTDGWGEKNTDCYKRLFRVFFWTKCENSHTTLLEKTYSCCFKYFFFFFN